MEPTASAARGAKRTVETLIADVERSGAAQTSRPWPIHGKAVGRFNEADYRHACEHRLTIQQFCVRRHLMARDDGAFVAAAFVLVAGHTPDAAIWQYHTRKLAAGEGTRDDLLDELRRSHAGHDRNVMIFDGAQLRQFVETAEIGLQDVLRLLFGLTLRQIKRRLGMGLGWMRERTR